MPTKKTTRKSKKTTKKIAKKSKKTTPEKERKRKSSKKEKVGKGIQLLRGMKDILPADQIYWQYLIKKAEQLAAYYGFKRIDTPILEMSSLFKRSIGDTTDVVEKEMYTFTDASGENISLRPEATASICRAYIEHGMINQPQPVKFYYWGPMFRHDRPQSGRYRQFYQFGLETIGEQNPAVDVELILFCHLFFKEIGLDINFEINSIGSPDSRVEYKKNLVAYYRRKKRYLCADCQKRLTKNPLRLLDCKADQCQEYKEEAPQIVDWLDEESRNHFMKVLEYLDGLNIPYNLNPFLVRGLDYYTKTVFEIIPVIEDEEEKDKRQNELGGGGRYDGLIELLGGQPIPACGFSLGLERIISAMRKKEIEPVISKVPLVFLAQIGEQAKQKSFKLLEDFRKEKVAVFQLFAKDSLKSQLELADKLGIRYVLILGQKEVLEGTILLRDMEGGVQETIDFDKVVSEVKNKLKEIKKK